MGYLIPMLIQRVRTGYSIAYVYTCGDLNPTYTTNLKAIKPPGLHDIPAWALKDECKKINTLTFLIIEDIKSIHSQLFSKKPLLAQLKKRDARNS